MPPHVAIVEAKRELIHIPVKVFFTRMMIDAVQPAFQYGPHAFYSICVNISFANVLTCAVTDGFMVVQEATNAFVPTIIVSVKGIVKLWNTRVRLSHLMPDSWRVRGFTAAVPPTSDRNNACEGDHPPTSSGTLSTPCDNLTVPPGYTPQQVQYHTSLCEDAGYLHLHTENSIVPTYTVQSLTWRGQEELAARRGKK